VAIQKPGCAGLTGQSCCSEIGINLCETTVVSIHTGRYRSPCFFIGSILRCRGSLVIFCRCRPSCKGIACNLVRD